MYDRGSFQRPHADQETDLELLRQQLEEARQTIRSLLREIDREQVRVREAAQRYNRVVSELTEVARVNNELERERDTWRMRVSARPNDELTIHPTPAEASAIRRAMARLHHPDRGGDIERMKLWNTILDPLE